MLQRAQAENDAWTTLSALNLKHPTGSFLPFKPNVDGEYNRSFLVPIHADFCRFLCA
jgi:hypothetical protein